MSAEAQEVQTQLLRILEVEPDDLITGTCEFPSFARLMNQLDDYYLFDTTKGNKVSNMLIFPDSIWLTEEDLSDELLEQAHLLGKSFDFIDWLESCVLYIRKEWNDRKLSLIKGNSHNKG